MTNKEVVVLTSQGISALIADHDLVQLEIEQLNRDQEEAVEAYQEAVERALNDWRTTAATLGNKARLAAEKQAAIIDAIRALGVTSHA